MPSAKRIARELHDKDYLVGKTLKWKPFSSSSTDRELCVFCWEPFHPVNPPRNEGFFEPESGDWICFPCLEAFISTFDWKIEWPIDPLKTDINGFPIF